MKKLVCCLVQILYPALLCWLLVGCADPVERDIQRLGGGGAEAEAARKRLERLKPIDKMTLVRAFRDKEHPAIARLQMVEIFYKLYLQEEDRRILAALIEGLNDPAAAVRAGAARILGELRQELAVAPLVDQLAGEGDDAARYQMLVALEILSSEEGPQPFSRKISTAKISQTDNMRFTRTLAQFHRETLSDSLRSKTLEWLEVLAAEQADSASSWVQKGDRQWAERTLLEARDLIPDSKNINWQLGRFYADNRQLDKGLENMKKAALLAQAPSLSAPPLIDGNLEEPAWRKVTPLTRFYRCLWNLRAYPVEDRAEIFLGYYDDELYIGFKGYEPSTHNLRAATTGRDDRKITRDDCIEIFLDVNHDHTTYFHIMANSRGAIADQYNEGLNRHGNLEWNGDIAAATAMTDTTWIIEMRLPAHRLNSNRIRPGDIWGFNFSWIRVANSPTYAQWAPTYGNAHRPDRFGFLQFN